MPCRQNDRDLNPKNPKGKLLGRITGHFFDEEAEESPSESEFGTMCGQKPSKGLCEGTPCSAGCAQWRAMMSRGLYRRKSEHVSKDGKVLSLISDCPFVPIDGGEIRDTVYDDTGKAVSVCTRPYPTDGSQYNGDK